MSDTGTTYEPRPGTLAYRVLAHLETLPAGTERSTGALAAALGVEPNLIPSSMEQALRARRVFTRKKDAHRNSPVFWCLRDLAHEPPPLVPPPGPQTPMRAVVQAAPAEPAPGAAAGQGAGPGDGMPRGGVLQLALWSGGCLEVRRASGEVVMFTAVETAVLLGYLHRVRGA
jgi:hypothetical protein